MQANPQRLQEWIAGLGEYSRRFDKAMLSLEGRTDQEVGIIAGAILEDLLKQAVGCFLVPLPERRARDVSKYLLGTGASIFGVTTLAEAFGIVHPEVARELTLLQRIRNRCAHSFDVETFDDPRFLDSETNLLDQLRLVSLDAVSALPGGVGTDAGHKQYVKGREIAWAVVDAGNSVMMWVDRYGEDLADRRTRFVNSVKSCYVLIGSRLFRELLPPPGA
jgi:hypothetical protein